MTESKLQETINQHGGNVKPVMEIIKKAQKKVLAWQDDRDAISAKINEARAEVKALGISKKAFDFALKRSQMDEDKRDQLDLDCSLACDAMNVPIKGEQGALFNRDDKPEEGDKDDGNSEEETSTGEQQADAIANAA